MKKILAFVFSIALSLGAFSQVLPDQLTKGVGPENAGTVFEGASKEEIAFYAEVQKEMPIRPWTIRARRVEPPALNPINAETLAENWVFINHQFCLKNSMDRYTFWLCGQPGLMDHINKTHFDDKMTVAKRGHESRKIAVDTLNTRVMETAKCLRKPSGKEQCIMKAWIPIHVPGEDVKENLIELSLEEMTTRATSKDANCVSSLELYKAFYNHPDYGPGRPATREKLDLLRRKGCLDK